MRSHRSFSVLFVFTAVLSLTSLVACGDNPHLSFEYRLCDEACPEGFVCETVLGQTACVPERDAGTNTDAGAIDASRDDDAAVADAGLDSGTPTDASIDAATADASLDAATTDASLDAAMDSGTLADAAADAAGPVDCEDDIHAWSNADLDPYRHCTVIGSLTIFDDGSRPITISDVSMPALTQVRRDVVISSTTSVTEIHWPRVSKTGKVAIIANEGVTEITFDLLTSTDVFFITDNAALDTIALPALDSATLLHVQNNPLIESLAAPLLRSASIKVHDSPALTSVAFPALQIAGFVWITSGPASNLDLLRTIDVRLLRTVTFERSPSASDYVFSEIDPAVGVHNVYGSAGVPYGEGAATLWFVQLPALESLRLDALELVENRLELTQTGEATADAFVFAAGNLEKAGHITISDNKHLEGIDLRALVTVAPHEFSTLIPSLLIDNNPRLVSLSLDELTLVTEEFNYSSNGGPDTSHVGLEAPSLEWVQRLVVSANPSLMQLWLPSLEGIGEIAPTASGLLVENNPKLNSLDLSGLTYVSYGDVTFNDNDALERIDLSNMTSIEYGSFYFQHNEMLHTVDLEGLTMMTMFPPYVLIATDNPNLCAVMYSFGSVPANWTITYGCG